MAEVVVDRIKKDGGVIELRVNPKNVYVLITDNRVARELRASCLWAYPRSKEFIKNTGGRAIPLSKLIDVLKLKPDEVEKITEHLELN